MKFLLKEIKRIHEISKYENWTPVIIGIIIGIVLGELLGIWLGVLGIIIGIMVIIGLVLLFMGRFWSD